MKARTWNYLIAATVCFALAVTFLAYPAVSTAQDGGDADLQAEPVQLEAPSETNRALFFFQNQAFASHYQQVAAAEDSVEIVVVSDADSFLEQVVTGPGWDLVAAIPDPTNASADLFQSK